MTTLAEIAKNENYLHLGVTPTPVEGPEDYFPAPGRTYYRWDVVMSRQGIHPSIDAYMLLMNYLCDNFDRPVISALPLAEDVEFEVPEGAWTQSIYVEAKDELSTCPAYIEDGSCIHSEHTK